MFCSSIQIKTLERHLKLRRWKLIIIKGHYVGQLQQSGKLNLVAALAVILSALQSNLPVGNLTK